MAARVLLRSRGVAPLAAAVATGGIVLYPRVAHAEAPPKKPIYDDYPASNSTSTSSTIVSAIASKLPSTSSPPPQPRKTPSPTDRLAAQISRLRLALHSGAVSLEDAVDGALGRAFAAERSVSRTVSSLAPPPDSGERIMPGLIYVLVSGLAGSIVSRNRGFLLRSATPLGFGVAAGWAVLPVTMGNVSALLWEWERKVPVVADAHIRAREGVERGARFVDVHGRLAREWVEARLGAAREAVEEWVRKGK